MKPAQHPLGSGYDAHTTARDVLRGQNLRGQVALVTGGHGGIGLETTRALAEAGATVVVGARTPEAARATLADEPRIEVAALDLQSPASVDAFAARFVASGRPLHMLVLNAGIMAPPLARDARGVESQMATNHLGHFQLTARLWPALAKAGAAGGARVVAVSSRGHRLGGVDLDDPFFERRPYDKWKAYAQSKTANVLFAVALDRRSAPHGVRAFAVHPGAIATDLTRSIPADEVQALFENVKHILKNPEQGAATSVWCATSSLLDGMGGLYCEDCDVAAAVPADSPLGTGVRPWATDPELAERLWAATEGWTGVVFTPRGPGEDAS
ncbi:MAG: SDR family NAD(P)-dependent oxidoreductase [Myxococcales bacterium]|nr:SDR family NAD(P)-dependent oxidoreductase [Myxococcales bacterium]MCB9737090.1 SDR family NAD(P)-dependent oxidoreductase [Deltaproteobacteria bacterium]